MKINFIRKSVNNHFFNYYENEAIIFGFTEWGFILEDLPTALGTKCRRLVELEQVHSDIIRFSSEIEPGVEGMEGDGIILDERGTIAVIKTADCTPLFFWDTGHSIGGVIHIGWQGLLKGIEKKLTELLIKKGHGLENFHFYMGPAIEKTCYEVGPDLFEKFATKTYRDTIFSPVPLHPPQRENKYWMDVREGIGLSLQETGTAKDRITKSGLCTFCEAERFPSYRREKGTGTRIFNFLLMKK
ncbi:MAG: polyphenol oxidase family protein [bacterium]|nr:polyphenol oxidase family protein [bacterium]